MTRWETRVWRLICRDSLAEARRHTSILVIVSDCYRRTLIGHQRWMKCKISYNVDMLSQTIMQTASERWHLRCNFKSNRSLFVLSWKHELASGSNFSLNSEWTFFYNQTVGKMATFEQFEISKVKYYAGFKTKICINITETKTKIFLLTHEFRQYIL